MRSYSLNGNFGGRGQETQTVFDRENLLFEPSLMFVFIDEHEESIDDGHFLVWSNPDKRWVNLPAGRHNQSGVLSFADGHTEVWHWLAAKKFNPRESYWKYANGADLKDLRRIQQAILPMEKYRSQP
jgi:prepilin-type processing-associated H-X9-DG protein